MLDSRLPGCLPTSSPALPCPAYMYISGLAPPSSSHQKRDSSPQLHTLSSHPTPPHPTPSHIPRACIPFSFPFPIPTFIALHSTSLPLIPLSSICCCSTVCVFVTIIYLLVCLPACLLTCYHSTTHSRSGCGSSRRSKHHPSQVGG